MDRPVSRLVFLAILSFIFGVFISPYFRGILFLPLIVLLFLRPKKTWILILFFLLGVFYYGLQHDDFQLPLYEREEITVYGKVAEEDRDVVEVFDFEDEKVIIYDDGNLHYGEVVEITGQPNVPSEEFSNYFHRDNISVQFFDPDVKVIEEEDSIRRRIYEVRRSLIKRIERGANFPESEILKAVLLGDRSSVPDELDEKFSIIGVSHLLAVSGTHIVIISGIILSFFGFLSIKWKYFVSIVVLFAFVLLVGAPVSAIRAGFLGAFMMISKVVGRKGNSLRGITFIAFLMLVFNPMLIRDVAFRLSFSASAGIILFSDRLKRWIASTWIDYKRPELFEFKNKITKRVRKLPDFVLDTVTITLSAQVFTLPLVFYYFGNLPILAPVSNLILAPLLPIVMVSGILGLVLSFLITDFLAFLIPVFFIRIILILVELFYTLTLLW